MPPLRVGQQRAQALVALAVVAATVPAASACTRKIDRTRCEELVGHFAELVVRERLPDAGADVVRAEQAREAAEARRSDAFRSCTTEVQESELACALRATTSEALLACLE